MTTPPSSSAGTTAEHLQAVIADVAAAPITIIIPAFNEADALRRVMEGVRFRDRFWSGYHAPRHWILFPLGGLRRVRGEIGLRIRAVRLTPGHAFWLWSFHHYVRYEIGRNRLGRWLNPATCLPGVALVTALDLVRARLCQQTDNTLFVLRK